MQHGSLIKQLCVRVRDPFGCYSKATFKMSYKKRSGKIQDTLAKLLQEFEGNLKDATDAEKKALEGTEGVPRNGGRK